MLRAFRLLRVLKLAKAITSLRILLATVMEVALNVTYMTMLLVLFVFIFAVLGMQCTWLGHCTFWALWTLLVKHIAVRCRVIV